VLAMDHEKHQADVSTAPALGQGMHDDEADLARMGYKQELKYVNRLHTR
jgi:hypothetical protein